jgi:hypothetical protein
MNFPALVAARVAALVLAAAALLSACTVEVEQPRPLPPYGPQSGYCTREYAPVCARRGSDRETFDNGCLAEEAGYRILRSGECRYRGDDYGDGGGDYGDGGGNYDGGGGVAIDKACSRDLNPVCARRGNDQRTFANDCRAEEAGFQVVYGGECQTNAGGGGGGGGGAGGGGGGAGGGPGGGSQECSKKHGPVCAKKYGKNQTFPNACRAQASDYKIVYQGECLPAQ